MKSKLYIVVDLSLQKSSSSVVPRVRQKLVTSAADGQQLPANPSNITQKCDKEKSEQFTLKVKINSCFSKINLLILKMVVDECKNHNLKLGYLRRYFIHQKILKNLMIYFTFRPKNPKLLK